MSPGLASIDTIAAIATPPGRGGVGIIRVSGSGAANMARQIAGRLPPPRVASLARLLEADASAIDTALLLYFPAPASFTGEAVLELHCHGGSVVLDSVLQRLLQLGARLARQGEFSERAFLNGKLDLAQAEAVADLIDAGSRSAARAAQRSLNGEFSRAIHALVEELIALRLYVEAAIDFPEEEIDFLADGQVQGRVEALQQSFARLRQRCEQGRVLREGITVVLAGRPNMGKSSLLNALAGSDSAIVTDIPGTTRDVLREQLQIDGLPLHIIDTAGLRESSDPAEQEGIRRARAEMHKADRVLLLIDDRQGLTAADQAILASLPEDLPVTLVHNKCDLSGQPPQLADNLVRLSVKTGTGMALLHQHLKHCANYQPREDSFLARRRHLDALDRACAAVNQGHAVLLQLQAGELLAEELQQAQQALGEITGEFSNEDLLGRIFSSFCIGK